jgi:hypothetical protein
VEEEYHRYLFSYYHNNSWWSLVIPATSEEDARTRLNKLPLARLDGTLVMEIPAIPGAGLFVRLVCWWRSRGYRRKELLKTAFYT